MPERTATIGAGPTKQPRIGADSSMVETILSRLKGLDPLVHPSRHLTMRGAEPQPEAHIGANPMAAPQSPGIPSAFNQDPQLGEPNIGDGTDTVVNDGSSPMQAGPSVMGHGWPSASTALSGLRAQMPQRAPEPWSAAPKSPDAPGMFTQRDDVGTPNIQDNGIGTVENDHPERYPVGDKGWVSGEMGNTPAVLKGLQTAGGMDDPSGRLFHLQDKLRDEVAGNLSKAQGAGSSFQTGATPVDLARLNSDLAENPVTQYQAQKRDLADKQYQASLGGFKSPQEAAAFGQSLEARKATAPTDVARINAQGNIDVQKLRESGSDSFLDRMMQMRAAGIDPGTIIRGPNGMQFSTAPISNTAQGAAEKSIEKLTQELHNLENPSFLGPIPLQSPFNDTSKLIAAKKAEIAAAMARAQGRPAPTAPVAPMADPRREQATKLLSDAGMPTTEANINHVLQQLQ